MLGNLSAFQPEHFLSWTDNLEFLIRIGLSAVLGILVGLERSVRSKEAGIRTHCIVAMTAAVFMILSKYAFMDLSVDGTLGVKGADPARITAQVVSGISFLGAGIIFKHGHSGVTGLTTAAGMWATAAIGMAIGAGMYWVGMFAAVLVLLTLHFFHSNPVGTAMQAEQRIYVKMQDGERESRLFQALLEEHHCEINTTSVQREKGSVEMNLSVHTSCPLSHADVMAFLGSNESVYALRVEN